MIKVVQKGNIDAIFDIGEAYKEIDRATTRMVNRAKANAPVAKEAYYEYTGGRKIKRRPGRLKRNIKYKERKTSFRVYVDMGTRGAPYALFQEVGFKHWLTGKTHPGKFFMEDALNATLAEMDDNLLELADKCLNIKGHNGREVITYK